MTTLRRLQINTTGAWRNVVDFDAVENNEQLIRKAAVRLAVYSAASETRLRIVSTDGRQTQLASWTANSGWRPRTGGAG